MRISPTTKIELETVAWNDLKVGDIFSSDDRATVARYLYNSKDSIDIPRLGMRLGRELPNPNVYVIRVNIIKEPEG